MRMTRFRCGIFSVVVSTLLATVFCLTTAAAQTGVFDRELEAIRACRKHTACEMSGVTVRVLADGTRASDDVRALLPRLAAVAAIQVDLWSDSILGGSYEAEPGVVLDRIEGLYRGARMIAYRLTYSARAWRLNAAGARTQEGRISESAFVALSLQGFFRDERAIAEFRSIK